VARGLSGVELVISDAHGGIKAGIAAVLSEASWQRCRTCCGSLKVPTDDH
jgi:putative transposase